MIFGVPTHTRYDLLDRLLTSVAAGDEQPSKYVIVDNGGGYTAMRARKHIGLEAPLIYMPMKENIGVAASWNLILDIAGWNAIISNDDVVLGKSTFWQMSDMLKTKGHRFVSVDGWALFGQTYKCLDRVGYYDENFWPAYYEDVDYAIRLKKAGIEITKISSWGYQHEGWATTRTLGDAKWLKDGRYRNMIYLLSKWRGIGWESVESPELYETPFNGAAPPGWAERNRVTSIPTRWDVFQKLKDKGLDPIFVEAHSAQEAREAVDPHRLAVIANANPYCERITHSPPLSWEWTGDVWKEIVRLRWKGFAVDVIDADYGIAVVYPGLRDLPLQYVQAPDWMSWEALESDRRRLLGLVDWWDWEKRLDERLADSMRP